MGLGHLVLIVACAGSLASELLVDVTQLANRTAVTGGPAGGPAVASGAKYQKLKVFIFGDWWTSLHFGPGLLQMLFDERNIQADIREMRGHKKGACNSAEDPSSLATAIADAFGDEAPDYVWYSAGGYDLVRPGENGFKSDKCPHESREPTEEDNVECLKAFTMDMNACTDQLLRFMWESPKYGNVKVVQLGYDFGCSEGMCSWMQPSPKKDPYCKGQPACRRQQLVQWNDFALGKEHHEFGDREYQYTGINILGAMQSAHPALGLGATPGHPNVHSGSPCSDTIFCLWPRQGTPGFHAIANAFWDKYWSLEELDVLMQSPVVTPSHALNGAQEGEMYDMDDMDEVEADEGEMDDMDRMDEVEAGEDETDKTFSKDKEGGAAGDGEAENGKTFSKDMERGEADDGEAENGKTFSKDAEGGEADDGEAEHGKTLSKGTEGGEADDGEAENGKTLSKGTEGGEADDGEGKRPQGEQQLQGAQEEQQLQKDREEEERLRKEREARAEAEEEAKDELFKEDEWKLIFAQDGMIEGMTKPEHWLKELKCTPSSPVCSELGNIEAFEQPHGGYWFKLVWPELASPLEKSEQEWKQAEAPGPKKKHTGQNRVEGYADADVPFEEQNWGGLQYNGISCLWDGSIGSDEGWYAVGAVMEYQPNLLGSMGGFKGPGKVVHGVKLYTKLPTKTIPVAGKKSVARTASVMDSQEQMQLRPMKRLVRGAWRRFKNTLRN